MNAKLYIYKLKLLENDETSFLFSAIAESETQAKSFILNKVKNEIYNEQLKLLFNSDTNSPIVYEKGDVFIQQLGDTKFFTQ